MKKNMGSADRLIRILLAVVFLVLNYANVVTGVPGLLLFIIAIVFLVTSVAGVCPLYSLLGIKTCSPGKHAAK